MQKLFADQKTTSATHKPIFKDNLTAVAGLSEEYASYLTAFYEPILVQRIRFWIACIAGTGRTKKKFNEESNHHSFLGRSGPDCVARRQRARSAIHPIRREPAYSW